MSSFAIHVALLLLQYHHCVAGYMRITQNVGGSTWRERQGQVKLLEIYCKLKATESLNLSYSDQPVASRN